MADPIRARATVHLQGDPVTLMPGQEITIDPDTCPAYFAMGYLVPVDPLPQPDEQKPAKHRTGDDKD